MYIVSYFSFSLIKFWFKFFVVKRSDWSIHTHDRPIGHTWWTPVRNQSTDRYTCHLIYRQVRDPPKKENSFLLFFYIFLLIYFHIMTVWSKFVEGYFCLLMCLIILFLFFFLEYVVILSHNYSETKNFLELIV